MKNQWVEIHPNTFDLWVAGKQVTYLNHTDVLDNGNVKYEYTTKTLTLNGAYISVTDDTSGIKSRIDNLTINCIGTSNITQTGNSAQGGVIYATKNLKLKGINGGKIVLNSLGNNWANIGIEAAQNLEIDGLGLGISSYGNDGEGIGIHSLGDISISNRSKLDIATSRSAIQMKANKQLTIYTGAKIEEGEQEFWKTVDKITFTNINNWLYSVQPDLKITPTSSGLQSLSSHGIKVWGGKGVIHITSAEFDEAKTIHVYNVSGALVRTLPFGYDDMLVSNIPAGIYMVKIGDAAEKVIVR